MSLSAWSDIASKKQRDNIEKIPKELLIPVPSEDVRDTLPIPSEVLSDWEILITETDVTGPLDNLRVGKWTSIEVTKQFARATIVRQLTKFVQLKFYRSCQSKRTMPISLLIRLKPS